MMSSFTRQASHGAAALRRALSWPSRVSAARRAMRQLARMSDYELRDIGLVRQDIVDASMLGSTTIRPRCWRGGAPRATRAAPREDLAA